MAPENLLYTYTQTKATCPCPETGESNPCHPI